MEFLLLSRAKLSISRFECKALGAILLVAALLRLWPVSWGAPPQIGGADELYHAEQATQLFYHPRMMLTEMATPLYDRVLSVALLPAFACHQISHRWSAVSHRAIKEEWETIGPGTFYLGRVISALFDVVGVFLTFILARLLFREREVALIAAAFHALLFEALRHSHYMTPDTLATCLTGLALVLILLARENPTSIKWIVLTGVVMGLAFATKRNTLALIIPALLYLLTTQVEAVTLTRKTYSLALMGVAFGVTVAIVFPSFFFLQKEMATHLQGVAHTPSGGWYRLSCEGNILTMFLHNYAIPHEELSYRSFWSAMGVVPAILGLVGMVLLLFLRKVFVFPIIGFALLSLYPAAWINIVRYGMPAYPLFGVFAAFAVVYLGRRLPSALFSLLIVMVLVSPFLRAVQFDFLLSHRDSRVIAGEWIRGHIPKGSSVAIYADHLWSNPLITLEDYRIEKIRFVLSGGLGGETIAADRSRSLEDFRKLGVQYIVVNSFMVAHHLNPASRKAFPETVASYQQFYSDLDRLTKRVYSVEKNNLTQPGPSIVIYEIQ